MEQRNDGLTTDQVKINDRFFDLYGSIEKELKRRLKLKSNDRTMMSQLVTQYVTLNPRWQNIADELRTHGELRNLLQHSRDSHTGYAAAVSPRSTERLESILESLRHPTAIGSLHRKIVTTVDYSQSIREMIRTAYENDFSQFPVLKDGQFRAFITEKTVVRWMGTLVNMGNEAIDIANTTVSDVLRSARNPQEVSIHKFCAEAEPAEDVMSWFQQNPELEAVLITTNGGQRSPMIGVVTEWDAARYVTAG